MTIWLALACSTDPVDERPLTPSPVSPAAASARAPDLPMGQMPTAAMSKAEILGGEHITITGEVQDGCDGATRVDVIQDTREEPIPVTLSVLQLSEGGGPFEVTAPAGQSVMVTAICDRDRDGRISPTDGLSNLFSVSPTGGDVDGVLLEWLDADRGADLAMGPAPLVLDREPVVPGPDGAIPEPAPPQPPDSP